MILTILFTLLLLSLFGIVFGIETLLHDATIPYDPTLTIQYDPPNGFFSPSAIGIYVSASNPDASVYYAVDGNLPTFDSPFCHTGSNYIQLNTPFGYGRLRNLTLIAIAPIAGGGIRNLIPSHCRFV